VTSEPGPRKWHNRQSESPNRAKPQKRPTPRRAEEARSHDSLRAYAKRVAEILLRLDQLYPRPLAPSTIATLGAAGGHHSLRPVHDKRVNEVTPAVRQVPTPADFAAVRPSPGQRYPQHGFFNNKAKSIVGAAKKVVSEFGGTCADHGRDAHHPGAARKTATWCSARPTASPPVWWWIPTFSASPSGSISPRTPTRQDRARPHQGHPQDKWILFAHQIILHGRAQCQARSPSAPSAG